MAAHRVLVVDDDQAQRSLFTRLLGIHGFQPMVAASAVEALGQMTKAGPRPDLMLIDISMPGMDGITLMKALRAHPATALTPMILMSGLAIPDSLMTAAAEALGAGPIYLKGSDQDSLLTRIKRSLESPPFPPLDQSEVVIDPVKQNAWIGDRQLPKLPGHRFQLLCALARAQRPVSREELLSLIWDGSDNLNVVDVTIARLRRDLMDFPALSIATTPAGYRLIIETRPPSD